jgi:formylglycine-generating enzyme required for sulfatase activity
MPLSPGQTLDNRYRIVKLLGQSGNWMIYRAWDINLGHPCTVKENPDSSPEAQDQFECEVQLLSSLQHPQLPRTTDHFIEPGSGQYIVMDFVEGEDLLEKLRQAGGPIPETTALAWIGQVCEGLTYLHNLQPPVIHGEVNPTSIRISADPALPVGKAMLFDFGIPKTSEAKAGPSPAAQTVKPGYSPVEQYESGASLDARADIYAVGATLYHLLTGQKPVDAPARMQGVPLPSVNSLNPAISTQIGPAIERAMALLPEQRWQSVADFMKALTTIPASTVILQKIEINPPPEATVQPPAVEFPAQTKPTDGVQPPAIKGAPAKTPRRWIIIGAIGILLALACLVGGAIVVYNQLNNSRPKETTAVLEPTSQPTRVAVEFTDTPLPTATQAQEPTTTKEPTQAATDTPVTLSPSETPTETTAPTATEVSGRLTDEKGVEMVLIPEGEFLMGSTDSSSKEKDEKPQHTVYLDAYFIDMYEVTNALFGKFIQDTGYRTSADKEGWAYGFVNEKWKRIDKANWLQPLGPGSNLDGLENYPVVQVSWEDATAFCEWRGGRLPTEAEWEKAARGTDGRIYPWGNTFDGSLVNFCDKNCPYDWADKSLDDGFAFTAPVGSYPGGVSVYGVFDMAGNVWEWVQDWYGQLYYSSPKAGNNPTGPTSSDMRVLRGGSWGEVSVFVRTAKRYMSGPISRSQAIGFRCARNP